MTDTSPEDPDDSSDSGDRDDSPPNQSTAAALLTAQSIVIAALAIASHRLNLIRDSAETAHLQAIGFVGIFLIGFSFLASIVYLYAAEYPDDGILYFSPRTNFRIALITLVLVVYIGLVLALITIANG
ncbi:hypothetical protein [Natronorubrum sp. A-ect3]|uniref:hypothetical protein n=1 Tax=Natronorubrum sp. A-ect3 TaxID=3242698 RepID=UPI00359DB91D